MEPGIFLTPLAGILADRIGRKTVLIPSLFIFALGGFAIFFVQYIWQEIRASHLYLL